MTSAPKLYQSKVGQLSVALMPTLMVGLGMLVLISLGAVLAMQWVTGRAIIHDFAGQLIERNLSMQQMALTRHLDSAVNQASFLAAAIRAGRFHLTDANLEHFAAGALAAAPQIGNIIIAASDGKALRVVRGKPQTDFSIEYLDANADPQLAAAAADVAKHQNAYWGPPVYREASKRTFLNYRVPVRNNGSYLGFVAVTISTGALSRLVAELSNSPKSLSFMLYGGNDVLAHPSMINDGGKRSVQQPLPMLKGFTDAVIGNLAELPRLTIGGISPPPGTDGREVTVDRKRYLIFTRPVPGYPDLPVTVGVYTLASKVDAPLRLFYWAMILGLVMVGLALIVAAILARAIARPVRRAAIGAAAIGKLNFDAIAPLESSHFKEVQELSSAFNAMLDGLKAFGRYVPRGLVSRLIKEGRVGAGSEQRQLAIMFTDIAGFTAACENLSPDDVAQFINHHLALVTECIERENGTIDKYIGDAVMAFWGAPAAVDDPALSACRSAIAIQKAIAGDNLQRAAAGRAPVRVRIGIHLGQAVVGDIGTSSRINYTIVGDAVNAAQRLEGLGKEVDPGAETITLVSGEIATALAASFKLTDQGTFHVKGKERSLQVFRLTGEAQPQP